MLCSVAKLRFLGGAHNGSRTHDLILTKNVLCRLSYVGPKIRILIYAFDSGF